MKAEQLALTGKVAVIGAPIGFFNPELLLEDMVRAEYNSTVLKLQGIHSALASVSDVEHVLLTQKMIQLMPKFNRLHKIVCKLEMER